MIEKLNQVTITDFNKETLKILKLYFDADLDSNQTELWFNNLLKLSTHSLGIAHCVQHNHTARLFMSVAFADQPAPTFFQPDYEKQIGSYSNVKSSDGLTFKNNQINGVKHWLSNLHQADYGILMVPVDKTLNDPLEAYVLFDFTSDDHQIDPSSPTQIGMEIARAGSLIVNDYNIPDGYLLGQRQFIGNKGKFIPIGSWHDYAFITNYLGCIIGLFNDLSSYTQDKKINVDYELKRISLEISSLKMMWSDNLISVEQSLNTNNLTDGYWHRRNTQYTQSKNILLSLINLVLQVVDSRWLDLGGSKNQRFRDALVFSTHMKPLYRNLNDKHFVGF
jgi:hypothetical protein